MTHPRNSTEVTDLQRSQVVRLITRSFVSELMRYGMPRRELVSISTELLDHAMTGSFDAVPRRHLPTRSRSSTEWPTDRTLAIGNVTLVPANGADAPVVNEWLLLPATRNAFYTAFPDSEDGIAGMLEDERSRFCLISAEGQPVGLIGGALDSPAAQKIEMRKLVGEVASRGMGIGKRATMLWLHLMFARHGVNKVFLHSLDTNIRNINLNSRFRLRTGRHPSR
jgi:RimJ/RimL family protein N-acetyltransferase